MRTQGANIPAAALVDPHRGAAGWCRLVAAVADRGASPKRDQALHIRWDPASVASGRVRPRASPPRPRGAPARRGARGRTSGCGEPRGRGERLGVRAIPEGARGADAAGAERAHDRAEASRYIAPRCRPGDWVMRDGMRLTTPPRTLIDLAVRLAPRDLERALDEAHFRGLVSTPALAGALERNRGRPGSPAASKRSSVVTSWARPGPRPASKSGSWRCCEPLACISSGARSR